MAIANLGKGGGQGGPVKNPKKCKIEEEEEENDNHLVNLVIETNPETEK